MSDSSLPVAYRDAAKRVLEHFGRKEQAAWLDSQIPVYGFAKAGNTYSDAHEGTDAKVDRRVWYADAILPDGTTAQHVGINPTNAGSPRTVLVALVHAAILGEAVAFGLKDGSLTKREDGTVAGRQYSARFTEACKGILAEDPRTDGKASSRFMGSRAFTPATPAAAEAFNTEAKALPPLPFTYKADPGNAPSTVQVNCKRADSESGVIWRCSGRMAVPPAKRNGKDITDADREAALSRAEADMAAIKLDGMIPVPGEGDNTFLWLASLDAARAWKADRDAKKDKAA